MRRQLMCMPFAKALQGEVFSKRQVSFDCQLADSLPYRELRETAAGGPQIVWPHQGAHGPFAIGVLPVQELVGQRDVWARRMMHSLFVAGAPANQQ